MRKTVTFAELIRIINHRNRHSTCAPDIRQGWNDLLATVLLAHDAYAGFGYLYDDEVPEGHKPGCNSAGDRFKNTDDSRRIYFTKGGLS